MRLIDLTKGGEGSGRISRCIPDRDPGTDDTLMWDVDMVFEADDDNCAALEPMVPGVCNFFARARDGFGSYEVKFRPSTRDIRIEIANEASRVVVKAAAEIREVKASLKEKKGTIKARLRVFAVDEKSSGALAMCKGRMATLVAQPQQQSLPLGSPNEPKPGDLVSAISVSGAQVYGLYRSRRDDGKVVVDDFGAIHLAERITSRLVVSDDDECLEWYRKNADSPSWGALIVELGKAFAAGDEEVGDGRDGRWRLTPSVVEMAVELPPEVDDEVPAEDHAGGDPKAARRLELQGLSKAALRAEAKGKVTGYSNLPMAEIIDRIIEAEFPADAASNG